MIKDLNRINKLGYDCEIVWNDHFHIYFDFTKFSDNFMFDEILPVLNCMFTPDISHQPFEKYIEESCQIFYTWYNKNHNLIELHLKNSLDKNNRINTRERIENTCLGDITKKVVRQIKIDDVIDDY